MRHWDAATYERVSDVQVAWAEPLLERLPLRGDETVLDAGCGSGRVTRMLLERVPRGRVVAVDSSADMVEHARASLPERALVLQADLTKLELADPVDAVFSNAVFHWVLDHEALFARLLAALKPGGRLVAQCGGEGNIAEFLSMVDEVAATPAFAAGFSSFERTWCFPGAEETERVLRRAGFGEVRAWLEPSRVTPADPHGFLRTVVLGVHLAHLPEDRQEDFLDAVLARSGERLELTYIRLNIDARRP